MIIDDSYMNKENLLENFEMLGLTTSEIDDLGTLDIESILENANSTSPYLQEKTIEDIHREVFEAISEIPGMTNELLEEYCRKLAGYRYVEKLCDLQIRKNVRWIRKDTLKLTRGGLLLQIAFEADQVKLLCKSNQIFFRYTFDDCVNFQKLTVEEQLILLYTRQEKEKEENKK